MKRLWHIALMLLAVLVGVTLLASAWGGTVDPRKWGLPGLVAMALPIVAVVAVVALIVLAILRQKLATAIVAVAMVLSLPAVRTVWPMSWSSSPSDESQAFTVMTWNVLGFRSEVARRVLSTEADLVLMQECSFETEDYLTEYTTPALVDSIKARYPYRTQGCSDVVILSRVPFTLVPNKTMRNLLGAYGNDTYHTYGRIYDLNIQGHSLRIVAVHMQSFGLSGEDKALYKDVLKTGVNTRSELRDVKHSLLDKVTSASRRRAVEAHQVRDVIDEAPANVIVCGDFNDTPGSYTYRTIKGDDFTDSFVKCGTWPINTFNRDGLYFKIDHMLYRGDLKAVSTRRERWSESDHYPIITTFEWTQP